MRTLVAYLIAVTALCLTLTAGYAVSEAADREWLRFKADSVYIDVTEKYQGVIDQNIDTTRSVFFIQPADSVAACAICDSAIWADEWYKTATSESDTLPMHFGCFSDFTVWRLTRDIREYRAWLDGREDGCPVCGSDSILSAGEDEYFLRCYGRGYWERGYYPPGYLTQVRICAECGTVYLSQEED